MHVLFIHNAFPSNNEEGSGRAYDFAKELVEHGHRVSLVASQYSYLTGESVVAGGGRPRLIVEERHPAGFTVYRAWAASGYHGSYLRRALSFLTYMFTSAFAAFRVPDPDVIVACSPPVTVTLIGGLVAWIRRLPLVVEVRDLWVKVAGDLKIVRSRLLLCVVEAWERRVQRQAVRVVVNSPGFIPYLTESGVPADRISLVPNGVDTALFRPLSAQERARTRELLGMTDRFVAVYAGSLGLANDLPTVLEAAEHLRGHADVCLLLVGDGNRRAYAEQEVAGRGLTNVVFTGPVAKQRVPEYLGAADVCFCTLLDTPLFRTVYPNKIFDGMACARPLVVLVDGVIRECVEEADAGLCIPPGDARGMAEAILFMRDNPDAARRYGERGRAYVVSRFDRWQNARLMRDTLAGVVNGRRPS